MSTHRRAAAGPPAPEAADANDVAEAAARASKKSTKSRISWLHIGMILFMFGPAIFPAIIAGTSFISDVMSGTSGAAGAGADAGEYFDPMQSPYRKTLVEFYHEHAPEKATTHHLNELLTKYRGRERKLFRRLERKYVDGKKKPTSRGGRGED